MSDLQHQDQKKLEIHSALRGQSFHLAAAQIFTSSYPLQARSNSIFYPLKQSLAILPKRTNWNFARIDGPVTMPGTGPGYRIAFECVK